MKIAAPIMSAKGKPYQTLNELVTSVNTGEDSSWLDPDNHLYQQFTYLDQHDIFGSTSSPASTLSQHPVFSMTEGEIVACRLNRTYPEIEYQNQELPFSGSFALVKSLVKPDPNQAATWLEFYTLYQGLAAHSDSPQQVSSYQAKVNVIQRRYSATDPVEEKEKIPVIPASTGLLVKKGERVEVTEKKTFLNNGKPQPFGLAKKVASNDEPTGEAFWVTLLPEYMQKLPIYTALTAVSERVASEPPPPADSNATAVVPAKNGETLAKGQRIIVSRTENFLNGSVVQPFGLAQRVASNDQPEGNTFWVTLLPQYMAAEEQEHALSTPAWMQEIAQRSAYDKVYVPATPIKVSAGDVLGYPGLHLIKGSDNSLSNEYGLRIELFIQDANLPSFLTNPRQLKSDSIIVRWHKAVAIYQRSGTGKNSTFTKTNQTAHPSGVRTTPLSQIRHKTDSDNNSWYEITYQKWVCAQDVDLLHQYDLQAQGFSIYDTSQSAPAPSNTTTSLLCKLIALFRKIFNLRSNQDATDDYSPAQIASAREQPDSPAGQIVSRLILKGPSIYYAEHNYPALTKLLESADAARQALLRGWLAQQIWMDKVPEIDTANQIYSASPLVFLQALADKETELYEFETSLGIYAISEKAAQFILSWEGYSSKPYVPAGSSSSGVTVGYGYDLGQQTQSSAQAMLSQFYPEEQVSKLLEAVGKKGAQAKALLPGLATITITPEKAFTMALQLKKIYSERVISVFPEAIDLPADSAGAILSLVYNRGNSLATPKPGDEIDSRKEMREIQQDLATGQVENLPQRLRSMKRLWPTLKGLINRREGEALLIEDEFTRLKGKLF